MNPTLKSIIPFFLYASLLFIFGCGNQQNGTVPSFISEAEYTRSASDSLLLTAANSKDDHLRLVATRALARIEDPASGDVLGKRLHDPVPETRAWAAFGLGQLRDSSVTGYLTDYVKKNKYSKTLTQVLPALGKTVSDGGDSLFLPFLKNENPDLQAAAVNGCGYFSRRFPLSEAVILELLKISKLSSDPQIRATAVYAISNKPDTSLIPAIASFIHDTDPAVSYFAVRSLYRFLEKAPETASNLSVDSLIITAVDHPEKYVRYYGMKLLKYGKDLPPEIFSGEDSVLCIRQEKIHNLKYVNDELYQKAVKKGFMSNNPHLGGASLIETASLNPRKALRSIQKIVKWEKQPQLYYAAAALREMKPQRWKNLKDEFLKTDNRFWLTNVYQLAANNNFLTIDDLSRGLSLDDPAVTTILADHLTRDPRPELITSLVDAFKRFDPAVDAEPMIALLKAVDKINSPESEQFFKAIARDSSLSNILQNCLPLNHYKTVPDAGTGNKSLTYIFDDVTSVPDRVEIITDKGSFVIDLLDDVAPVTVRSFIHLAQNGYFNGLAFHRVVPGFVVQGGDPRGDGWGGPGYTIPCEYSMLPYERGTVGMAHAGKDTGGSQFFITLMPQPHLNGRYTVWGKVVKGIDVGDKIMVYDKIKEIKFID